MQQLSADGQTANNHGLFIVPISDNFYVFVYLADLTRLKEVDVSLSSKRVECHSSASVVGLTA